MNTKRKISFIGLLLLFVGMLSVNSVLLAAAPCDPHTPLDCNVIIVTPPYNLTFNADAPGTLLDKAASNLGTGFTMSLPASAPFVVGDPAATSYVKANLTVNTTSGQLEVVSTKGLNVTTSNSQNNALGVGLAAPVAGTIVLDTTITNLDLTAQAGQFQQVGLWFGEDQDNYIKFVVVDGSGGTYLETIEEVGGVLGTSIKSANQDEATLAAGTLRMVLTVAQGTNATKMQYSINGGTLVNAGAGQYTPNAALFNGIATKEGAITAFAGLMTSHRNGTTPITARFNYFNVRTSANAAPTAVNNNYTMDEDTTLTENAPGVLGNDTDPTSDPLTAVLVAGPTNAQSFTLAADGSFTYTPVADFFGPDSFTYRASDGVSTSNIATVTITVNDVEETTVAVDDAFDVDEDTDLIVPVPGVLDNDIAVGAGTAEVVVPPTSAQSFTLQNNGRLEYTPLPNFSGTDSFTYQIEDGAEISNIATVTITVNPINDPPVVGADDYTTTVDTQLVVAVVDGVLSNDTDVDEDTLEVTGVQTDVTNGTLVLAADGSFTYDPDLGFLGEDSFVYNVTDGTVTLTGTATISVVNDVVELLENGGFEAAGTTGKTASNWKGSKLLQGDRRICTNKGVTDACAFRFQFKGSTNFIRQITQVYKTPITVSAGDKVNLSAFVKANQMDEGGSIQIIVQYTDNTKATGSMLIQGGTYAYTELNREVDLDKNVKKITVRVRYNGRLGNGGTFFVDDVTLLLSQTGPLSSLTPSGLVPVPAAPADLRGN